MNTYEVVPCDSETVRKEEYFCRACERSIEPGDFIIEEINQMLVEDIFNKAFNEIKNNCATVLVK